MELNKWLSKDASMEGNGYKGNVSTMDQRHGVKSDSQTYKNPHELTSVLRNSN